MENVAKYLPKIAMTKTSNMATFISYARSKFPEISDELIVRNLCEIITAYEAEFKCVSCCMGLDMCSELINSAGYSYAMTLQANGWIKIEYVPCVFNGGKEIGGIQKKGKFTQVGMFD